MLLFHFLISELIGGLFQILPCLQRFLGNLLIS